MLNTKYYYIYFQINQSQQKLMLYLVYIVEQKPGFLWKH